VGSVEDSQGSCAPILTLIFWRRVQVFRILPSHQFAVFLVCATGCPGPDCIDGRYEKFIENWICCLGAKQSESCTHYCRRTILRGCIAVLARHDQSSRPFISTAMPGQPWKARSLPQLSETSNVSGPGSLCVTMTAARFGVYMFTMHGILSGLPGERLLMFLGRRKSSGGNDFVPT